MKPSVYQFFWKTTMCILQSHLHHYFIELSECLVFFFVYQENIHIWVSLVVACNEVFLLKIWQVFQVARKLLSILEQFPSVKPSMVGLRLWTSRRWRLWTTFDNLIIFATQDCKLFKIWTVLYVCGLNFDILRSAVILCVLLPSIKFNYLCVFIGEEFWLNVN